MPGAAGASTTAVSKPPAEEVERAEDWSSHRTAEGRRFYYNKVTKARTWKRPEVTRWSLAWPPSTGPGPSSSGGGGIRLSEKLARLSLERPPDGASPVHQRGPSHSGASGDTARVPESDAALDTGTSTDTGFVMDDEGYLNRVDALEEEYQARRAHRLARPPAHENTRARPRPPADGG